MGVLIESFDEAAEEGGKVTIHCAILVERDSQKPILIGHGGPNAQGHRHGRQKGTPAAPGLRRGARGFVKVRPDWRENASVLREMGLA